MRRVVIAALVARQPHLLPMDVDMAARHVLGQLTDALAAGERIEVRGFGSFKLRFRPARLGRNPRTGTQVALSARYSQHFKPGTDLRRRINNAVPGASVTW